MMILQRGAKDVYDISHQALLQFEFVWEIARTQSPATKNYAPELPTFGVIAGVSNTGVQW